MTQHPTLSWQAMQDGNVFYRKQQLYSIQGKLLNLSDYVIAGCRYGGPLGKRRTRVGPLPTTLPAIMRDSTKLIALGKTPISSLRPQIQIISSAGEPIMSFSWDQGKIIRFGWTHDERLVILSEEGIYRLYDLQGEYQQFSLGNEAADLGVVDARIHENGLVALTGALTLLEVKGWRGGRSVALANPGLSQPPHAWNVIPPDSAISRHVEALLSVESTIYTVDSLECVDQRLGRGPFIHVSPSPNGKSLALLTFSGLLWVVSTDFQRSMAEFDTSSVPEAEGAVRQVEWCGNDAILVTWDNAVSLIGPFGDRLQFYYTGPTFAVTEPDGVRIIGPDSCDFIQKVPASTMSVFRPGSTSPAAILYDAWESFSQRSPEADDNVRSIRPDLAKAVDDCVDAAGQEWEPHWQRQLLNAAKFGRGYLDLYNPTEFVNMGQILKVLNAIRFYEIGLPLTYAQYTYTSPSHLVERLTSRNLHLLALRISNYLSMKPDAVLKHWATAKILRSKPTTIGTGPDVELGNDEEVCRVIVEKFQQVGGVDISYADIAKRAWEAGRTGLATKLLDYESKASDQVPLLLSMKEDRLALAKAVDSGDTNLVYQVLLDLYKRLNLGDFFHLIDDGGPKLAPASKLLQVYAREQNREMLRDFYYSDDRRVESAILSLEEASRMTDHPAKITAVKAAQRFFSEDKDRGFEAKMMDESIRLLTFQDQLEKEAADRNIAFFGLSVSETIKKCLVNGMSKRADKTKADFKVPDKRFWYLKLQALTEVGDFDGLEAFSKSKRSPIGYEPFVRHLVAKGHSKEAIAYVARCDSPKRVDLYVECGDWRMAGKECKERGDKAKLEDLRRRCPNSMIARELEQIGSTTGPFHPQNDPATYSDLLMFEERLKSNALILQRRKSRYQLFLLQLLAVIAFLLLEVVFLSPEESLLVIPYKLLLQRVLPRVYTSGTQVVLPPYIASGLLFVAITTLVLFFASGMYSEKIAYANKYVPHANRALRSFNIYLNVRKPPLRSKFKFLGKPLSFLFPRPENERPHPIQGSPPPIIRTPSPSPSTVRPIPSIPPATNPRGELIFSSRVDRTFREGYERYRSAFEKRREEKERILRRQKFPGWLTNWWWDTAPGPAPSPSGTSTPVRTLSASSTSRARLTSSRSSTPPASSSATRQDTSSPLRRRQVTSSLTPSSGLSRQASLEGEVQVVL
ncbi:hypothetical protein APHAL10511_006811 [Amanita phalloides]|nr:hypothetical protein APHAL10511_006811 [Amanita phalloides]